MRLKQILLCFVVLIFVIGCQPVTEIGTRPVPTPSSISNRQSTELVAPVLSTRKPPKDDTQLTQPAPTSPSTGLEILIEKARADLAKQLSIPSEQIVIVEAKAVTWPDASLGCPQPGVNYSQVLNPGFLIRFDVNGKEYEYHTDMQDTITLCSFALEENSSPKNTDTNFDDGWPNQTENRNVIITTPTPRK